MINLIRQGDVRKVVGVVRVMEAGRVREIGKGVEVEADSEAEGMSEDLGRVEIVREKTGNFSRYTTEN